MTSPASAPIIVKPRMRSSLAPTRTFIKPCVSSVVAVRRTAFIGSFATRAATPWRFASASFNPTWARGGSVNMQYGTSRARVLRSPPARLSLMMRKSSSDACVNCGLPAHSPIAQTLGAVQPLIDANVPTSVQLDAGLFEPDAGGIGNASCRGQDIAALDLLLTGGRTHGKAELFSGSTLYIEGFGRHQNLNTFVI